MIKSSVARSMNSSRKLGRNWALSVAAAQVAVGLLAFTSNQQATMAQSFWDINGATAGAGGATPAGTWSATTTDWNTDSTGAAAGAVSSWTPGSAAVFSAGTDATGKYTVTVSGTQSVSGLTTEEGTVSLSGGTLDFGANPITITTATPLSISSLIGSTAGTFTKAGSSALTLTGVNTFSGSASISAGSVIINNNSGMGNTTIDVAQGASFQLDGSSSNLTITDPITIHGTTQAYIRGVSATPSHTDDISFPTAYIGAIDNKAGNNTITGTVTLAGEQGNIGQLGLNTISVESGSLTVANSMTIQSTSGVSALAKTGPGTLILQAANAYPTLTRLWGGTLVVQADGAAGANTTGQLGIIELQGTDTTFALQAPVGSPGFTYNAQNYNLSNFALTTGGYGHGSLGAVDNLGGDNTFVGNISVGSPSSLSTSTGDLAQDYFGVQSGSLTIQGIVGTAGNERAFTKIGSGNLIFESTLNQVGPFEIAKGTVTFTGAPDFSSNGNFASSTPIITWLNVNSGTTLSLDNSTWVYSTPGNGTSQSPINVNVPINLFNSELKLTGSLYGSQIYMDFTTPASYGILNAFGMATFTTVPQGGTTTIITPVRTNNNTFLVRGMGDGMGQITIGGSPSLVGGGGTGGDPTVSILPYVIGDASATGSGTDFVTYDSGLNSLRVLTSSEYATLTSGNSTIVNAKAIGTTSLTAATTVNALKLTGATVNVGSTLTLNSGAILATGGSASQISGGNIAMSAEGIVSAAAGSSLSISSAISGNSGLTISGGGTVTLSGTNTFSGGLTLNGGTLAFSSDSNLGDPSNTINLGGGLFKPASTLASLSRNFSLIGRADIDLDAGQTFTLSGNLTSPTTGTMSGSLIKSGNGTLVLTGTNTYAGGTTILGGILSINSAAAYAKGSGNGFAPMTIDGGTLQFTGGGTIVLGGAGVNGTPYGIQLGKNNGTIDVAAGTTVQWGADQTSPTPTAPMYGPGSLTKTGGGTWEFLGDSPNYDGGTFINGGTLQIDLPATLPSAGGSIENPFVTINNTGRFMLNNVTVNNIDIYMNNGGTLAGMGTAQYSGKTAAYGPQIGDGANVTFQAPNPSDVLTIAAAMGNVGSTTTPTVNFDGQGTVFITASQNATFKANYILKNGVTLQLGSSATATAVLGAATNTITIDATGGILQPRIGAARTFGAYPVTINGPTGINMLSTTQAGGSGFVATFGTLKINGNQTITLTHGTADYGIISGTLGGATFGNTTLAGNPTFNISNPPNASGAIGRIALGKITESGGSRSITKTGNGQLLLQGSGGGITGTLNLNAGSLSIGNSGPGSATTGTPSISRVVQTAGTNITIADGSKLTLTANGTTASILTDVPTIAGTVLNGELDITNNKVVLDYTSSSPIANLRAALASGAAFSANVPTWAGGGIVSITAKNDAKKATGIGYLEASSLLGVSGGTYGNVTVDGTALLMKEVPFGDVNMDGKINGDDYTLLDLGFNKYNSGAISAGTAVWQNGDFNYDGVVDSNDFMLADTSLGIQQGILSPDLLAQREAEFGSGYVNQLIAAVPEPTSLSLIGLASAALLGTRRRRQS